MKIIPDAPIKPFSIQNTKYTTNKPFNAKKTPQNQFKIGLNVPMSKVSVATTNIFSVYHNKYIRQPSKNNQMLSNNVLSAMREQSRKNMRHITGARNARHEEIIHLLHGKYTRKNNNKSLPPILPKRPSHHPSPNPYVLFPNNNKKKTNNNNSKKRAAHIYASIAEFNNKTHKHHTKLVLDVVENESDMSENESDVVENESDA